MKYRNGSNQTKQAKSQDPEQNLTSLKAQLDSWKLWQRPGVSSQGLKVFSVMSMMRELSLALWLPALPCTGRGKGLGKKY